MSWIKRNLFFTIGGVVALLLLGAAGWYDYKSWTHNSAALDRLNEISSTLTDLGNRKPSPGNAKIDNIQAAKDQEDEVLNWIDRTGDYFKPITPVPNEPEVTSEEFAAALRRMIVQLQQEAGDASVMLPPNYSFSFEAQRSLVKFAPESLDLLAVQLGEVKTISEVLFASRVNSLDGIQRVRVSVDDAAGPQTDYNNGVSVTNDLAVVTPYVVTFRGFSPELSSVLDGFAASPHGLIVESVNVQPAGAATQAGAPGQEGSMSPQPGMPLPGMQPPMTGAKKGGCPRS